ncbi:probable RNA-binding protein 18 isoform X2 [Rhodnius prolixus]|uniref:probable RNA-binding protein 18 isoform X2 n=1 Tax=Rhodnius prolixus TaxID=13249 RepID=UPI003D1894A3
MPLTTAVVPIPQKEVVDEDRRVWIGNLDTRITEFQLLKIVQKYGSIDKFDLMYHKSGPLAGQSRGFAFVTFTETSRAEVMMEDLNGKKVGNKVVVIKWAHTLGKEVEKTKSEIIIPALGQKERKEKKISRVSQIHAIESKLKMMQQLPSEDFQISNEPSTSGCLINVYNHSRQHKTNVFQKTRNRNHNRTDTRNKPYFRK